MIMVKRLKAERRQCGCAASAFDVRMRLSSSQISDPTGRTSVPVKQALLVGGRRRCGKIVADQYRFLSRFYAL